MFVWLANRTFFYKLFNTIVYTSPIKTCGHCFQQIFKAQMACWRHQKCRVVYRSKCLLTCFLTLPDPGIKFWVPYFTFILMLWVYILVLLFLVKRRKIVSFGFTLDEFCLKGGYAPISRPSYALMRYAPGSRGRLTRPTYALYLRLSQIFPSYA